MRACVRVLELVTAVGGLLLAGWQTWDARAARLEKIEVARVLSAAGQATAEAAGSPCP